MHTTLGQLALVERALRNISALRFPVKIAYSIHKLTSLVETEMRFFHQREEAWIRELGEADDKGNITVLPEHRMEYFRRMAEMSTLPVALGWRPLTLAELETGEDPETKQPAKLTPADLLGLGPLLADEVVLPSAPDPQDAAGDHDDTGVAASGMAPAGGNGVGKGVAGLA